jgi:hypothetical protein
VGIVLVGDCAGVFAMSARLDIVIVLSLVEITVMVMVGPPVTVASPRKLNCGAALMALRMMEMDRGLTQSSVACASWAVPCRVPVTARAQLSALLYSCQLKLLESVERSRLGPLGMLMA